MDFPDPDLTSQVDTVLQLHLNLQGYSKVNSVQQSVLPFNGQAFF